MIDLAPAIRKAAEALHQYACPAGPGCPETNDLGNWIDRATVAVEAIAEELIMVGAVSERLRLFGDEDETVDGILDRVYVKAVSAKPEAGRPHPMVFVRCNEDCGDGGGTALMVARDLEGSQRHLTLAELAYSALNHFDDEHP